MLSRASFFVRRMGVRSISGSELVATGSSFGNAVAPMLVLAGGLYVIDAKIESKTNHLETKLDTLAQSMNTLAVCVARIEEHIRK